MQQIYLNIVPNGICPRVYVNQYDVGRGIQIKFKDGSANYGFASGTTFKVNGRKSDGHVFEYTEADKWDDTNYIILKSMPPGGATTVYLYTTEQMTAASGEVLMQLTYKLDNAVQGTLNFIMIVQERPEASGDPSESDVPGVVRLVNGVAPDGDGNVDTKWKDMSSVSNLSITENTRTMSTTRNAGTYVYVKTDDQLYVITSTISSGGTLISGTNATATSVGAALSTLTSDLMSLTTNFGTQTITTSNGVSDANEIKSLLSDITYHKGTEIISVISTARFSNCALTILMQNIGNTYGYGIAFGYYSEHVYTIKNANRTFTVTQIA